MLSLEHAAPTHTGHLESETRPEMLLFWSVHLPLLNRTTRWHHNTVVFSQGAGGVDQLIDPNTGEEVQFITKSRMLLRLDGLNDQSVSGCGEKLLDSWKPLGSISEDGHLAMFSISFIQHTHPRKTSIRYSINTFGM